MNFSKLLVLPVLAMALAFTPISARAQRPGGRFGGQRPDPVARLTSELHLNQGQQNKISAIFADFRSHMQSMRGNSDAQGRMRGMFQELQTKIEGVLNPAQKKKFEAMGGMRGVMGGGPGARIQRLLAGLHLTPSQQKRVDHILGAMRAQMEAARRLPQDQRRDKMRAMMQEMRAKIESVLTPSQRKQFEQEMQQGRMGGPRGGAA